MHVTLTNSSLELFNFIITLKDESSLFKADIIYWKKQRSRDQILCVCVCVCVCVRACASPHNLCDLR